jgi:hypothetical protein
MVAARPSALNRKQRKDLARRLRTQDPGLDIVQPILPCVSRPHESQEPVDRLASEEPLYLRRHGQDRVFGQQRNKALKVSALPGFDVAPQQRRIALGLHAGRRRGSCCIILHTMAGPLEKRVPRRHARPEKLRCLMRLPAKNVNKQEHRHAVSATSIGVPR